MIKGLGTILNVVLLVAGGLVGLLFGSRLKQRIQETLLTATGIAVVFLGIGGAMSQMLKLAENGLTTSGSMMMIVSLAIGSVIGEILDIDGGVERFGQWLKIKSHSTGDASFVDGFVTASCTVCIGAMAVVGSVQDGISGDYTTLLAKGILDAIIICIMAASQGKGCVFSAIPVAIFQGTVTVIAMFAGSFLTQNALDNLSFVGSILIFCVGLNLIRDRRIRVANLLPAIVVAAAWGYFG